MDWKEVALSRLKQVEGGYVNDPYDNGGETNHGITIKVARENGYTGNMRDLTLKQAQDIYIARYWHPLNLDAIAQTMPRVALEMFDSGVNCGIGIVGTWLQIALNAINVTYGPDLVTDGKVGPATLKRLAQVAKHRGAPSAELAIFRALDCQQGQYYLNITRNNPTQRRFAYGWLMNRVGK